MYGAWQAPGSALGAAAIQLPGRFFWRTLAVLGVVGTALAAAYLLRVLQTVWHGDADQLRPVGAVSGPAGASVADDASADAGWPELAVGVPLAVLTLVLGLLPWLVLRTTEPSVQRLLELARGAV